jgi:hypothetical protein
MKKANYPDDVDQSMIKRERRKTRKKRTPSEITDSSKSKILQGESIPLAATSPFAFKNDHRTGVDQHRALLQHHTDFK